MAGEGSRRGRMGVSAELVLVNWRNVFHMSVGRRCLACVLLSCFLVFVCVSQKVTVIAN